MAIRPLLFFDIEVYPNRYFAVFADENGNVEVKHHDQYLDERYFTEHQLVGFNSNCYDDALLDNWGLEPSKMKRLSDMLVRDEQVRYTRYSLDVLRQLKSDPTIGIGCPGLKEIAFNKGEIPKQTPVPFDKPVPPSRLQEVVDYCVNDVMVLKDVFADKREFFDALFYLHDNYNFSLTQTAASNIDKLFQHKQKPKIDLDKWRNELAKLIDEINTYNTIELVSGEGGIHGAEPSCKYTNVMNLDVASQYPSIIINLGLFGEKTALFKEIRDTRLRIKKTHPIVSGGLKIILNTAYGVLNGDKGFFRMENKEAGTMVCIYGQYSICSLMLLLLKKGATIIQINTDGVMFTGVEQSVVDEVVAEWERTFNMQLELDMIDKVIQKDVNNYVAMFTNGKVKTKGGDLSNSQGRRIYKKNTSIVIDKMVYNLLADRGIEEGIVHYDYARFLRPTAAFPRILFGDTYHTEGIVVLPYDERGKDIVKVKPTGEQSRFTNITTGVPYSPDIEIPWEVRAECIRVALDKVYGRYRKDGELYSSANPWLKEKNKKDLFYEILAL